MTFLPETYRFHVLSYTLRQNGNYDIVVETDSEAVSIFNVPQRKLGN